MRGGAKARRLGLKKKKKIPKPKKVSERSSQFGKKVNDRRKKKQPKMSYQQGS